MISFAGGLGCEDTMSLPQDSLLDPVACQNCHPVHYEQWASSMHAYGADDPVFVALNNLLQKDTNGAGGDFCVKCHAPMAVATGATTDGLNIQEVSQALKGVTCYFCHQIDRINADHNGDMNLAWDVTFRAGHKNPLDTLAHGSAYSELHDGNDLRASDLCGSCHDVVTPAGVRLETTFREWKESIFGRADQAPVGCSPCHMPSRWDVTADVTDAPTRRLHDHGMPGVDTALTPAWPGQDQQRQAIQRDLDPAIKAKLCVERFFGTKATVTLDNVLVGHAWPSGSTHARRAWVELRAFSQGETVFESGVVAPDEAVAELPDPNLWIFRSYLFDEHGEETMFPWRAASVKTDLLRPAITVDPLDPGFYHAQSKIYQMNGVDADRVTMAVHYRPVGLEVVDALIEAGELEEKTRALVPTFTLRSTELEWDASRGFGCVGQ